MGAITPPRPSDGASNLLGPMGDGRGSGKSPQRALAVGSSRLSEAKRKGETAPQRAADLPRPSAILAAATLPPTRQMGNSPIGSLFSRAQDCAGTSARARGTEKNVSARRSCCALDHDKRSSDATIISHKPINRRNGRFWPITPEQTLVRVDWRRRRDVDRRQGVLTKFSDNKVPRRRAADVAVHSAASACPPPAPAARAPTRAPPAASSNGPRRCR